MPSAIYVDGASGLQKGISTAETGIKVSSVTTTASDPKIMTYDEAGSRDGFVHGFDPEIRIVVEGEIAGTTGLMTTEFGLAATIANEADGKYADTQTTYWGISAAGTFWLDDSPEIRSTRDGLKTVTLPFISWPDITD